MESRGTRIVSFLRATESHQEENRTLTFTFAPWASNSSTIEWFSMKAAAMRAVLPADELVCDGHYSTPAPSESFFSASALASRRQETTRSCPALQCHTPRSFPIGTHPHCQPLVDPFVEADGSLVGPIYPSLLKG